jgi:hypothetical protein
MKSATKKIKRASYESAAAAMVKHQEIMTIRGWKIHKEFGGNAGCKYEFITVFVKGE